MAMASYREVLKEEMYGRLKKNDHYSVRAFARDLELSPAYLSQVLNGKRDLSEARAYQVAELLKWTDNKIEFFIDLVRFQKNPNSSLKAKINRRSGAFQKEGNLICDDTFEAMASWEYFAIIELTSIKGMTIRTLAYRLGLPFIECQQYVHRMLRLEMVEVRDGLVHALEMDIHPREDVALAAGKKYHQNIFKLAAKKIKTDPHQNREYRSMMIRTTPEKMAVAKEKIRQFEKELVAFLESGDQNSIYQFSTQYFRVDRNKAND